jgi:hypothetical protein
VKTPDDRRKELPWLTNNPIPAANPADLKTRLGPGWVSGRKSSGPSSVKRIREKPKPLTSSADIAFVPPKLFDCAECNFTGTAEGFTTHMAQWHQKVVSTKTRPGGQKTRSQARVTNNIPNEPFAFCKICGVRVLKKRLGKHGRKVHAVGMSGAMGKVEPSRKPPNRSKSQRQETGTDLPSEVWKKQVEERQSQIQPNLDHTKPYAHPAANMANTVPIRPTMVLTTNPPPSRQL